MCEKHQHMTMYRKDRVLAESWYDEHGEYHCVEYGTEGKEKTEIEKLPRMDRIMRYGNV